MYALYVWNPWRVIMYIGLLCGLENKFNACNPVAQKDFCLVLVISQQLLSDFAQGRYQQVLCLAQPVALAKNLQIILYYAKVMLLISRVREMMCIHLQTRVYVNTVSSSQV